MSRNVDVKALQPPFHTLTARFGGNPYPDTAPSSTFSIAYLWMSGTIALVYAGLGAFGLARGHTNRWIAVIYIISALVWMMNVIVRYRAYSKDHANVDVRLASSRGTTA